MNLEHVKEVFENISFCEREINADEFEDCVFKNCIFEEAFIGECGFYDCNFEGCTARELTVKNCRMRSCNFKDCALIGISWDCFTDSYGDYEEPFEKIEACTFKYNTFTKLNFTKMNFGKSIICESFFTDCLCKNADFSCCNLENTQFDECNLSGADFRNANGWVISLKRNTVKGASFSFPEVVNLLSDAGINWE